MPKKEWTEEERKAFGEKMKAAKAAREEKAADYGRGGVVASAEEYGPVIVTNVEDYQEEVTTLDLTKENLVNESSVTELVRRMFDDGNYPDVIRVTSSQMIEIFDPSHRTQLKLDGVIYRSPFGEHWVDIIPRKELDEAN
jgi:hypothetical protein